MILPQMSEIEHHIYEISEKAWKEEGKYLGNTNMRDAVINLFERPFYCTWRMDDEIATRTGSW